ncbi:MAG: SOS response-associated peptidase family protein [Bdellovibrionales bacterium]|nr:SOS response-associated peptidase family protein [Bdellovibrionales bacterium]
MLTTEPNWWMGECHDRMPAILHPDDISEWLSVDTHRNWSYIRATLISGVTNL